MCTFESHRFYQTAIVSGLPRGKITLLPWRFHIMLAMMKTLRAVPQYEATHLFSANGQSQ